MPVKQDHFDYLEEVVGSAEDLVRLENPDFISGFHVISMQAHRVEVAISRLRDVKANLKEAEQILIDNIAGLRTANPAQKPKGTAYARRVLRNKPLWEKVVSAHTLKTGDKESIEPDSHEPNAEEESELAKALKRMGPQDAKIEFERHDYTLRHKLQGVKKLTDLITHYISILIPRLTRLEYLEDVGKKWTRRVFEDYDIEKVEKAQQLVVDSSIQVKQIIAVLSIFPADFTQLCELEDIGRGLKRKVDWTGECETPETMKSKRICTEGTRGGEYETYPVRLCTTTERS